MRFSEALKIGKTGESLIADFFKRKGYHVLPVYEKLDIDYKGPAVFCNNGENIVAPDMMVFNGKKTYWIEAKHKTAFSWHRNTRRWVTGIDAHHYQNYLKISKISEWPVWLFFLHQKGVAKDTPEGMVSPCGLYGGEINFLAQKINHQHDGWGRHGMVYWGHDTLTKIAELEQLNVQ